MSVIKIFGGGDKTLLERILDKLADLKSTLTNILAALNTGLSAVTAQLTKLQADNATKDATIASLQAQLAAVTPGDPALTLTTADATTIADGLNGVVSQLNSLAGSTTPVVVPGPVPVPPPPPPPPPPTPIG